MTLSKQKTLVKKLTIVAATLLAGCGNQPSSHYSLLSDETSYKQKSEYAPRKIDILWVIDNSGSMASSQANVANSFRSFISRFLDLKFDFHMAVTTTEAYKSTFLSQPSWSTYKDGYDAGTTHVHSGVYVIDRDTPDIDNVFLKNIIQGVNGSGDERAFSSFKDALSNTSTINQGFRRSDAFLAVIIVSDEDDFSWNSSAWLHDVYDNNKLYTTQSYVNFLDTYTGYEAGGTRNYSVSAISIWDTPCLDLLNATNSGRKIGVRYKEIVEATNGVKASLCDNFGTSLELISDSILSLSTTFKLSRIPVESSIVVKINGEIVPNSTTDGWTYAASTNSITFSGHHIPSEDSQVSIEFDPVSVKE